MAIASVRTAEAGGGLREAAALGLDREALVRILHSLLLTRRLDERGHVLFKQGKLPGSFYTCKGNEAASVGVAAAMAPDDLAAPLHRNLGLHLYRGVEPWRVLCQYMGRVGGTTNGRDSNLRTQDVTSGRRHRRRPLAPALDPARRGRGRARVPRARRAARRARLDRRRLLGQRHGARVDELRRRAAPAGRVRDRQQPVRLLHADAPQLRLRRRWPHAGPPTASRASWSTAPTCSRSTARRARRSSARARAAARRCSS